MNRVGGLDFSMLTKHEILESVGRKTENFHGNFPFFSVIPHNYFLWLAVAQFTISVVQ